MKITHININDLEEKSIRDKHHEYEYYRKRVVPFDPSTPSAVAVYRIPPKKSNFPYHYHVKNVETFFILSGNGELKTVEGIKAVKAGDFIHFPANPDGAHKLTNTSETEDLVYIDFDAVHDLDVCVYPDSNKIGIWGKNINQLHSIENEKDYYDGE